MSDTAPALRGEPEPLADSDYDTILAAVMETARGRWFLREFTSRNRNADTTMLLTAIGRIESLLRSRDALATPEPAATEIPAPPPHDPFADILALSPEERIALFT